RGDDLDRLLPRRRAGLQGLIHCLPLTLSFEPAAIAVGGSQAITDALVEAGRRLGVTYATDSEVDRIIASNGRASAIELVGGSRVAAGVVVSNDQGQLLWANLAIREPPQYVAEA